MVMIVMTQTRHYDIFDIVPSGETNEDLIRLISSVVHDDVWSLRVSGGVHDKLHISSAD